MPQHRDPFRRGAGGHLPVSDAAYSIRNLACVLLVLYHVIGADPGAGLALDYPHPLRLFADGLIGVRMPLFAFVAGAVYALRPPLRGDLPAFAIGKVRRLLLPGAVAALALAAVSTAMGNALALPLGQFWTVLLYPYAHYWFLQAMFVVLLVYALLDLGLAQKHSLPVAGIAFIALAAGVELPTTFFALDAFVYLFAYFAIGVAVVRHDAALRAAAVPLAVALALGLAVVLALNIQHLQRNGSLSLARQDVLGAATGLLACLAAFLAAGHGRWLSALGPYTFTIYLYHVFGTSLARRLLYQLGLSDPYWHLLAGLLAGLALPILLHLLLSRGSAVGSYALGLRPPAAPRQPA